MGMKENRTVCLKHLRRYVISWADILTKEKSARSLTWSSWFPPCVDNRIHRLSTDDVTRYIKIWRWRSFKDVLDTTCRSKELITADSQVLIFYVQQRQNQWGLECSRHNSTEMNWIWRPHGSNQHSSNSGTGTRAVCQGYHLSFSAFQSKVHLWKSLISAVDPESACTHDRYCIIEKTVHHIAAINTWVEYFASSFSMVPEHFFNCLEYQAHKVWESLDYTRVSQPVVFLCQRPNTATSSSADDVQHYIISQTC
jgi:hypothetical protein